MADGFGGGGDDLLDVEAQSDVCGAFAVGREVRFQSVVEVDVVVDAGGAGVVENEREAGELEAT